MKKDYTPSKQLGIPQTELAMLLGVSRSLYSMFECGQRSLPSQASLMLNEMLAHFHAPESKARLRQRNAELDSSLKYHLTKAQALKSARRDEAISRTA